MKREIIRAPILAYYNPRKETVLQQMPVLKDLAHVFGKNKDMYISQVKC